MSSIREITQILQSTPARGWIARRFFHHIAPRHAEVIFERLMRAIIDCPVPVIAAALSSGKAGARDLQPYVRAHRSVGWDHVLMTEAVLLAAARPWLMGRVVRALHRKPALFDRLLGVNDGSESVARALLGVGPGLALRMALG